MKKFILFFAIVASFVTSCKKDVVPPPDPAPQLVSTTRSDYSSTSRVSSVSKVVDSSAVIPADTIRRRAAYGTVE